MGRPPDDSSPGPPTTEPTDLGDETAEDGADAEVLLESIEVERHALGQSAGEPAGDLSKVPAPEVLHRLYASGATGALLLARRDVKKILYLRDGYPVAVKSNIIGECLGKILTWEGLISEEEHRRSLVAMRESGIRQGSALIRMGALSHHELSRGLELQLRFKICETFAWTDGSYRLWPDVDPPFESVPLSLSPAGLIHEGVRSFMPQPGVLTSLRGHADSYLCPTDDPLLRFQDIAAAESAESLLALVDGTTTVASLMRASTLDVRQTASLLYTLLCTHVVEPSDEPATKPSPLFDPEVEPDPPTDRSGPGDSAHRVDLAKLVARLRGSGPHEVLGVEIGAEPIEVRRAYVERALERHPDRMGAGSGDGLRALAETALALTAEAYTVVSGEVIGAGYEPRGAPAGDAIDDHVRHIVEAEGYHQSGLELLDRGRPRAALGVLARAVAACEQEGDFRASLAWAVFQSGLDSEAADEALGHLDEAIVRSPGLVRAHIYRGHVLRFLERREDSARAFEEALRRDPENEEAVSELARIRESSLLQSDS